MKKLILSILVVALAVLVFSDGKGSRLHAYDTSKEKVIFSGATTAATANSTAAVVDGYDLATVYLLHKEASASTFANFSGTMTIQVSGYSESGPWHAARDIAGNSLASVSNPAAAYVLKGHYKAIRVAISGKKATRYPYGKIRFSKTH